MRVCVRTYVGGCMCVDFLARLVKTTRKADVKWTYINKCITSVAALSVSLGSYDFKTRGGGERERECLG